MDRHVSWIRMFALCLAPAIIIGASFANTAFMRALNSHITTLLEMERSILGREACLFATFGAKGNAAAPRGQVQKLPSVGSSSSALALRQSGNAFMECRHLALI
jgi:hypothetical protein